MDNLSCKVCGELLMEEYQEEGYCKTCILNNKKDYHIIRAYIEKHPHASIMDVVNDTKVPLRTVNRMIEEDKFLLK